MIGMVFMFAGLALAAPDAARDAAAPTVAPTAPSAAAGGHVSDMPMPDAPPAAAASGDSGMTRSRMMKMTTEEIMMPAPKMPKRRTPR